ncbi:MAG: DUF305 domain-containing protein [Nocardioides sp.]|nr:DUF305 domain-containing protein [Nocardioides sp.]
MQPSRRPRAVRPRRGTALSPVLLPVVAALGAALLLVGCADDEARVTENAVIQPGLPGEEATTLPPGTTLPPSEDPYTESDVAFLVQMVPHHEQALAMAELAPDRASDERVLGLASRIADVQQAEIDVYVRWLADHGLGADGRPDDRAGEDDEQDHGDDGHSGDMSMPGMASDQDLAALAAADGAQFDRLWLELMVSHHEGALDMAAEREVTGTNIRVGELAADVAVTQLDEIATMQAVLDEL